MTVVIGALLALATATFAGANAWKQGANRATCIVNIRNVQQAVRSYQNMYQYRPGSEIQKRGGKKSIADHLLQNDFIKKYTHDQIRGKEKCPGGGSYSVSSKRVFPLPGQLFVNCSLAGSDDHQPEIGRDW